MTLLIAEPECTCGSDMLTFAGGGYPLVCTESYFLLLDEGALEGEGWSYPRLRVDRLPSREQINVHAHLLATLVDEKEGS